MNLSNKKRTCNVCGIDVYGGLPAFIKHGEEHRPDHFVQGVGPKE